MEMLTKILNLIIVLILPFLMIGVIKKQRLFGVEEKAHLCFSLYLIL